MLQCPAHHPLMFNCNWVKNVNYEIFSLYCYFPFVGTNIPLSTLLNFFL